MAAYNDELMRTIVTTNERFVLGWEGVCGCVCLVGVSNWVIASFPVIFHLPGWGFLLNGFGVAILLLMAGCQSWVSLFYLLLGYDS